MNPHLSTIEHYRSPKLLESIKAALNESGVPISSLTIDDFAPVDELHIRGRKATRELIHRLALLPSDVVLDLGSGLGGTSRVIATEVGCRVVGIDLVADFVEVADYLSRITKNTNTHFVTGSAISLPFQSETFDVVVSQHVQMNIQDKPELFREVWRVLRPGGRFCFHEVFSNGLDVAYPTPWASAETHSHLCSSTEWRGLATDAGFDLLEWSDVTEISAEWISKGVRTVGPLNVRLVLGELAQEKLENLALNLREGRVQVVQSVMTKSA